LESIDECIFASRKLDAIVRIRVASGATLSEAMELFYRRYEELIAESRERFIVDPDRYWDGFYS
jgi:hypothetical protein